MHLGRNSLPYVDAVHSLAASSLRVYLRFSSPGTPFRFDIRSSMRFECAPSLVSHPTWDSKLSRSLPQMGYGNGRVSHSRLIMAQNTWVTLKGKTAFERGPYMRSSFNCIPRLHVSVRGHVTSQAAPSHPFIHSRAWFTSVAAIGTVPDGSPCAEQRVNCKRQLRMLTIQPRIWV